MKPAPTTDFLIPGETYHVYNRANGNEKLFIDQDNYRFFLKKYVEYISPVANTFSYCLMPNHFHILITVKEERALAHYFLHDLNEKTSIEILLSKQFSNFFNSYSKAFNKLYGRKGNLFMRPFKRKQITDHLYLQNVVYYIHNNPVEARLSRRMEDYAHSSYRDIKANGNAILNRNEIIEWFGGIENFTHFHESTTRDFQVELE